MYFLAQQTDVPAWVWLAFAVLIAVVMAIDLGIFHREAHKIGTREALAWVCVWVVLALIFAVGLFLFLDSVRGVQFLTGYFVEYALSVDNIFVFVIIFTYFKVPPIYQHRVLFWGIIGAVVMRLLFIFAAYGLIGKFSWLLYIFGAFLVFTGIKLLALKEVEVHPEKNIILRVAKRLLRVTPDFHGQKFFVRLQKPPRRKKRNALPEPESPESAATEAGASGPTRLYATRLFLVLLVVEATDVVFAVDSVPAIVGVVEKDRFVAFTSNIFAILGLRALYFVLAGMMDRFHYLSVGLSFVLITIGAKMLAHSWIEEKFGEHKLAVTVTMLGVVVGILGVSIVFSLLRPVKPAEETKSSDS